MFLVAVAWIYTPPGWILQGSIFADYLCTSQNEGLDLLVHLKCTQHSPKAIHSSAFIVQLVSMSSSFQLTGETSD
jgi:hypothetical protein